MPLTHIPAADELGPELRIDLDQVVAVHFFPSLDADAIEIQLYIGMHVVTLVGPLAQQAWDQLGAASAPNMPAEPQ